MYVIDVTSTHVASFISYVSGLCNVIHWANGMPTVQ